VTAVAGVAQVPPVLTAPGPTLVVLEGREQVLVSQDQPLLEVAAVVAEAWRLVALAVLVVAVQVVVVVVVAFQGQQTRAQVAVVLRLSQPVRAAVAQLL